MAAQSDDDFRPGVARFDSALDAWVLSSYADVSAALRDPRLSVGGTKPEDQSAHAVVRDAAANALSPERLAAWRAAMTLHADSLISALPSDRPVDLVTELAEPWSVALAVAVTGADVRNSARLTTLAREVFLAAASATSPVLQPRAQAAAVELASCFPASAGGNASAEVQTFVALAQTLPRLLGRAWLELFRHPDEICRLRVSAEVMPPAVEELLRLAGPSRAVFRTAVSDVAIGGASIAAGERVVLMLAAANRDPARFPNPDDIDFGRAPSRHLAFGHGMHSCAGASLIRMAVAVATDALLRGSSDVELVGEVKWAGGFAIRGPASLTAVLRRV